ncbi:peptidylprolyl isomerase [Sungkyunkwania multivorans]|uniref:peptidylprolyl isomerase n=1 Tax=Sungkyunkwania multivorans TaxID=1173618 RepID=A0ABW3CU74_9FLAO
MKKIHLLVLVSALCLFGCKSKYPNLDDGLYADIQTNKGDILIQLEYEKTPITVANFVTLAEGTNTFVASKYAGKKFYDGVIFHRVMKDFMIQGGDGEGTGRGNPGYRFKDEFHPELKHDTIGVLSMANSGPATNGSQFFITHTATPWLDGKHTVFGKVVKGLNVVDSIAKVETNKSNNKPITDVVINTIEIIAEGKDAKSFDAVATFSDYFKEQEAEQAAKNAERERLAAAAPGNIKKSKETIDEQRPTAKKLPSGLEYLVMNEGDGEKPAIGSKVKVNYAGYFASNGDLFDSNIEDVAKAFNKFNEMRKQQNGYQPTPMPYSPEATNLIPGFREGLLLMNVGDKYRFFIPSHLAFGEAGGGRGLIPPNADLVFDVEIVAAM